MIALLALFAACVLVGVLIGAVGIGGVLLVPTMVILAGLSVHEAAATALFSFLFTGIVGGWLFMRRGSIEWRIAGPVCAGAFLASFGGAIAGRRIAETTLTLIIAAVLLGLGIHVLRPTGSIEPDRKPRFSGTALLGGIGALSGFGAGLTGAGGPLFSVPLMLAFRFETLAVVGTGQVVQIATSLSASVANAGHGTIRYGLGFAIAVAELVGTVLGVQIAHSVRGAHLRFAAAVLCIASAVGMALRAARQ